MVGDMADNGWQYREMLGDQLAAALFIMTQCCDVSVVESSELITERYNTKYVIYIYTIVLTFL